MGGAHVTSVEIPFSLAQSSRRCYSDLSDHAELKRERWTASVTYVFRENV